MDIDELSVTDMAELLCILQDVHINIYESDSRVLVQIEELRKALKQWQAVMLFNEQTGCKRLCPQVEVKEFAHAQT